MLDESTPTFAASGLCIRPPREADAEYFAAFDAQRARVLRKRIQWYCILAIGVLAMGVLGNVLALARHNGAARDSWIQILSNSTIIALYAFGLVYIACARPDRRRLVEMLTALTGVVLMIAMIFEVIAAWANPDYARSPETLLEAQSTIAWRVTLAFGLIFSLACILVPMTVRESMRIAGVGFVLFVVIMGVLIRPPVPTLLWMVALFVAFCVPGMAWSWWRFREFDARFQADTMMQRYQNLRGEVKEISAELTQARRLHEALFPAPLSTGPIHVGFAYEPMREIGGDFLFLHREPAGEKESPGAVTIVLIDVSGHGIPAALSVNRMHGELLRFFANYPSPSGESGRPGHVLSNLNSYACAALAPQGVFATALVLRTCPTIGSIEFASGGHPTAFLRKAHGETIDLPSTAPMLGVLGADAYLPESRELNFQAGDRVLAYTDGAMESRDASGMDFTAQRIRSLVATATLSNPPGTGRLAPLADSLMKAVNSFRHGPSQDDTLIVEVVHAGLAEVKDTPPTLASAPAGASSHATSRSIDALSESLA